MNWDEVRKNILSNVDNFLNNTCVSSKIVYNHFKKKKIIHRAMKVHLKNVSRGKGKVNLYLHVMKENEVSTEEEA